MWVAGTEPAARGPSVERRQSDAPRPTKAQRDEWYALAKALEDEPADGCTYCGGDCVHEAGVDGFEHKRVHGGTSARARLVPMGLMVGNVGEVDPSYGAPLFGKRDWSSVDAEMTDVLRSSTHWSRYPWREAPLRNNPITLRHPDGTVDVVGMRQGRSAATQSRLGLTRGVKAASLANLKRGGVRQGDATLTAQPVE